MTNTDLYNNLSQPVTREDLKLGDYSVAFSFMTGTASGTLADVKAVLVDAKPSDGGDILVQLYTLSGTKVADLGLIDDQTLSNSTNPTDIPITSTINLLPNTSYQIVFTGTDASQAVLGSTTSNAGTNIGGTGGPLSVTTTQGAPDRGEYAIAEVVETVCFCAGTLIRTLRGDVAVEDLAIGDIVTTASGAPRPIRWLAHRTIGCGNHPNPHEVMPVRIAAHAFADNRPARDLYVSPGHAICIDVLGEMLIPAGLLVNDLTIRQVAVEQVTYWHVELDRHDVILAENLPAESYLDMGNRGFFAEGDVVAFAASPDADALTRTHADFCRPFVDGGPALDAVRTRLQQRALSTRDATLTLAA